MDLDSRPGLAMMPAVCFDRPRQIHKAQRLTRDALIAMTGDRRTSQVWFAQYHGADAARNAMRNLGLDADPDPGRARRARPGAHLPQPRRRPRRAHRRRLRGHP